MYCSNCGNEFGHDDKFCANCGNPNPKFVVSNTPEASTSTSSVSDPNTEKILYGVVGFVAPVIGLILSLTTRKDHEEASKIGIVVSCLTLFVRFISFVISFIFEIL
jgi:uncharacterized OB-fold protein